MPCKKACYPTPDAAYDYHINHGDWTRPARTYWCEDCESFHITTVEYKERAKSYRLSTKFKAQLLTNIPRSY